MIPIYVYFVSDSIIEFYLRTGKVLQLSKFIVALSFGRVYSPNKCSEFITRTVVKIVLRRTLTCIDLYYLCRMVADGRDLNLCCIYMISKYKTGKTRRFTTLITFIMQRHKGEDKT